MHTTPTALFVAMGLLSAGSDVTAARDPSQREQLSCSDFERNSDGSWTARRQVTLNGISYDAGTAFTAGTTFAGKDWGATLNQKCR